MIDEVFIISDDIRYVAIYRDGHLKIQSKGNTEGASSSESDKYEESLAIFNKLVNIAMKHDGTSLLTI